MDAHDVARFLKKRVRYEVEVKDKRAEVHSLSMMVYFASVDYSMLKHFTFTGAFEDLAPDATVEIVTEENMKTYLKSLASGKGGEVNPARI